MRAKTVIGAAIVFLAVFTWFTPQAQGMEDELDHGVFKYLYTKETRRIYYEPIPLDKITENPKQYVNSFVTIKCRFHRLEKDLAIPEFTPFRPGVHMAFSVWDISARLWNRDAMVQDYPLFFVERGSDESQKLMRAKRFDVLLLYAKIDTLFDEKPWFEVSDIKFLEKNELNLTLFTHIQLAEDLAMQEQHDLAVEELERTLSYDLNSELEAMLLKRLGQSYYKIGKFVEAGNAFEGSWMAQKGDHEVYSLWGDALMAQGKYNDAIKFLNLSLKYLGKQADIYAKIGYCYAKVADAKINKIRTEGSSVRKEKKRDTIRRRNKKTRFEYTPARTGQHGSQIRQLTLALKDEILALYDQGIRECRKAIFVDPNLPEDENHLNDVKSKKAQFLAWIEKAFGAEKPAEPVKPVKKK